MRQGIRTTFAFASVAGLLLAACGDDSGGSASKAAATTAATSPSAASGTATSGGSASSGGAPAGAPYKIAVVTRLSGLATAAYIGTSPAVQAWEKSVNASGGINGHPVQVILKDAAGDAAKGLAATKEAVENDKVIALVPNDPSTDNSILPYTQEKKIPVVQSYAPYPIWNTTPGWFALGIQQNPAALDAVLATTKAAGKASMAAMVCAEVAACGAAGDVFTKDAAGFGVRYDGTFKVAATAPSYTAECLALKNKKTDMVLMGVSIDITKKIVADCATQGYTPAIIMNAHSFSPALTAIPKVEVLAVEGMLPWYAETAANKDFRDAMAKYSDPTKADMTSMYMWTSLEFIRQALTQSKVPENPTYQQVTDALVKLKTNLNGLISDVSFTAGQPSPVVKCYYVAGYSNGKFNLPQGDKPQCLK